MAITIVESIGEHAEYLHSVETVLHRKTVLKTCKSVMDAMKNELPEEAHSIEVFDYILKECKDILHTSSIIKL